MHPIRRLRALAIDLQGPIDVEQSVKFSAQPDELRFLLKVTPTRYNCAQLIGFAERSGLSPDGWLERVNLFDAIGVAVAETGSIRFYSQNSRASLSEAYYEGYKFYPDKAFRKDAYMLSTYARMKRADVSLPSSAEHWLNQFWSNLDVLDEGALQVLSIQNPQRESWFVQCEALQHKTAALVANMEADYKLRTASQKRRYAPQFGPLNHMAFGADNQHDGFVTFYFQSSMTFLEQYATNY